MVFTPPPPLLWDIWHPDLHHLTWVLKQYGAPRLVIHKIIWHLYEILDHAEENFFRGAYLDTTVPTHRRVIYLPTGEICLSQTWDYQGNLIEDTKFLLNSGRLGNRPSRIIQIHRNQESAVVIQRTVASSSMIGAPPEYVTASHIFGKDNVNRLLRKRKRYHSLSH